MLLDSNYDRWSVLDSVPSTNAFLLHSDLAPGSVVFARSQTQGRGRQGRRWIARPNDSVIFSGLLEFDSNFPAERLRYLPLLTGYAVLRAAEMELERDDALSNLQARTALSIKWPNDLYLSRDASVGKVGGILVESAALAGRFRVVLGVGLNYRGALPEVSEAQTPPAVLFPGESPGEPIQTFGINLVREINRLLPELHSEKTAATVAPPFLIKLREHNYLKGRIVRKGEHSFRVIDIADSGELILEDLANSRQMSLDDTTEDLVLV
ncbi:MAG: biotin--[acetyl-CoA-carboxylase] ligase [bacterium]|nr:biotin--[acetyl-CoA-carboxylase] ligase [bacterium]